MFTATGIKHPVLGFCYFLTTVIVFIPASSESNIDYR